MSGGAAILVTGASSQIGRCTVRRLCCAGTPVLALGRRLPTLTSTPADDGGAVRFLAGDLTQPGLTIPHAIESVVHIAGIWLLPPHLEALYERGARRIVCFSSTSIFIKQDSSSPGERALVRRMVDAEAEIAARCAALGIGWTVLRPTLVYGLGLDHNITRAARVIDRLGFYPLAADSNGLRQPVHADDLAAAALRALTTEDAAGRHYEVGGGETLPYREMIGRIFDALGRPRRFLPVPFLGPLAAAAGLLLRRPDVTAEMVRRMGRDLVCDNAPAETDLAYRPRPFLVGGRADLGPDFAGAVIDTRGPA